MSESNMPVWDRFAVAMLVALGLVVFVPLGIHLASKASTMDAAAWATWVQAVFSVLAIVAAIYVASNQHRRDLQLRLAQLADQVQMRAAMTAMGADAARSVESCLEPQYPTGSSLWVQKRDGMAQAAFSSSAKQIRTVRRQLDAIQLTALVRPIECHVLHAVQELLADVEAIVDGIESSGVGVAQLTHLKGCIWSLDLKAKEFAFTADVIRKGDWSTLVRR